MRNPRKYRHRIAVNVQSGTTDGYGGETLSGASLGSAWADITTIPQNKLQDYGLDEVQGSIRLFVRKNATIDWEREDIYIVYKSKNWHINSVTEVNLWDVEYEIIASHE